MKTKNFLLGMAILACLAVSVVSNSAVAADTPPPEPTPVAGGGYIVFTSVDPETGEWDLFSMNPDGSERKRITTGYDWPAFADISPDGSKIAFSAQVEGTWYIFTIDKDGSNLVQVTDFSSANSSWHPDGQQLVFNSDHDDEPKDTPDLWVMNLDGTGLTEVLDDPPIPDFYGKWSPDGSKILYTSGAENQDIFVMDADGSNVTQLTDAPSQEQAGRWSPNGKHIVYASSQNENWDIFVMDADGSNIVQLTDDPANDVSPSWSPDGNYILFSSEREGQKGIGELWMISVDGENLQRITNNQLPEVLATWGVSPSE